MRWKETVGRDVKAWKISEEWANDSEREKWKQRSAIVHRKTSEM